MLATARRRLVLVVALSATFFAVPTGTAHALPLFGFSGTTITFPTTAVGGTSAGVDVEVTNLTSSPLLVTLAGGAPGDPNFTGVQDCAGTTLAAGASCEVTYAFAPKTVGPHSATTSFTVNGESSGTISLSGTATPGFSIAPTTIAFPTTAVGGTSAGVGVVVTNLASSPQVLAVAGGAPGNPNFGAVTNCSGATLAAGASCQVTYTFTPQATGPHSASTSFTVNGQSSGAISLSGTATPGFSITPTTLVFPTTPVAGTSAGIDVVVTNLASSPQVATMAGGAPGDANFGAVTNCAGATLAAGASCAVTYTFTPQTAGEHFASTSFTVNGQSSGTISLSGTTETFSIAPSSLTFPTTAVAGTSADQDVLVTNRSTTPQTLSVSGGTLGDPNFDVVQNCAGVTLAPGASCAFTYTFVPQTAGPHSATTTFTVNDQSSGTITLTGTTPSATATATPSPSTGTLADTGSPVDPVAPIGGVLMLLLGGLLLLRRRESLR
jgi:LPXTG-motif cell wall-anchored protein